MINNAKANRRTNKQIDSQSDPTSDAALTSASVVGLCLGQSSFESQSEWRTDTHTRTIPWRVYTIVLPLVNMSFCLCSSRPPQTSISNANWSNMQLRNCLCAREPIPCVLVLVRVYMCLIFALGWFMLTKTINWPVNCLASKLHWPQEENQQLRQLCPSYPAGRFSSAWQEIKLTPKHGWIICQSPRARFFRLMAQPTAIIIFSIYLAIISMKINVWCLMKLPSHAHCICSCSFLSLFSLAAVP